MGVLQALNHVAGPFGRAEEQLLSVFAAHVRAPAPCVTAHSLR